MSLFFRLECMDIREITKRQFDAFCYSRQPLIRKIVKEVMWFEAGNKKLLATIVKDMIDHDFGFVILGRDAKRIFRCIDTHTSYKTINDALEVMRAQLQKYIDDGQVLYPQGDERKSPNDIFIPLVSNEQLHDYFKILMNESRFEAARNLIKEMVYSYIETDRNYIQEFQTHGFDARLWELYLYVYLYSAGFEFIKGRTAPDYHLSFFGEECFVEAVTVNPSCNLLRPDPAPPTTIEQVRELRQNYLPIKYGSALFSKLQKKYWEMDHVKGRPLIIAIHDFHMVGSMTWSRTALADYLYGVRVSEIETGGRVKGYHSEQIKNHSWNGKTIPSGFFKQPGAEHISAVLFTNAATISKFNRMGKLAGLGSKDVKLIRQGFLFNPDPRAFDPIPFTVDVDSPDYEESWSDSLIMYHNPDALCPVDCRGFQDISHASFDSEKGLFTGHFQPYDVLMSITLTIASNGKQEADDAVAKL